MNLLLTYFSYNSNYYNSNFSRTRLFTVTGRPTVETYTL